MEDYQDDVDRLKGVKSVEPEDLEVLDLWPGQNFDNYDKVVKLLSGSKGHIWFTNYYFASQHFKILSDVMKQDPRFSEIRILLKVPDNVESLEDLREKFRMFRKQYSNKFEIQMRFITDKKTSMEIHDRYLYTQNKVFNFIEMDSLLRNQRATISQLPNEFFGEYTNSFVKWWNDRKTFDVLKQWNELKETVKKREISKQESMQKKIKKDEQALKQTDVIFTYFKTNKGITITAKDNIVIELYDAIKESSNLEVYSRYNGYPYIGFVNNNTKETIQFIRSSDDEWYAESPMINRASNHWEGWSRKAYGTWEQVKTTLELFFNEEPWTTVFDWKVTKFTDWVPKKVLDDEENQRISDWSDLR